MGFFTCCNPVTAPALNCPAVHERGIEFGHAVAIQDSAASGVEQRVVLEDTHRGDRGVETGAAARQHGMAGTQGIFESRQVFRLLGRFHVFAGQRARPTVNGDREHLSSRVGHGGIVCAHNVSAGERYQHCNGEHGSKDLTSGHYPVSCSYALRPGESY
jgi:hypothetical protein